MANASIADVMVHVDETLPPEEMRRLEEFVRHEECIVSACFSPEDAHLLMITFNPYCTTSDKIVHRVREQGVHGTLVGL